MTLNDERVREIPKRPHLPSAQEQIKIVLAERKIGDQGCLEKGAHRGYSVVVAKEPDGSKSALFEAPWNPELHNCKLTLEQIRAVQWDN